MSRTVIECADGEWH